MALDALNVKIEPMNVTWGEDRPQIVKVKARADAAGDLGAKYFFLYSALNAVKYYVWFNTGASVDPAIAGHTGIEVGISSNDSATAVASAMATDIGASVDFNATSSGSEVTITAAANGYATPPREGLSTGFAFSVSQQGDLEEDIGFIDGDIEVTANKQMVDVTGHQRGTEVLAQIITGSEVEVGLALKETTKARLRRAFLGIGGSYIPAGADGTELYGLGQYKNFSNTLAYSSRLVLHPVRLPSTDRSEDVCFWKAFPMLDAMTFSGENILTIPVTFKPYPDSSKPEQVQHVAFGDWKQLV